MKLSITLLLLLLFAVSYGQDSTATKVPSTKKNDLRTRKHVINIGPMPLWLPIKYEYAVNEKYSLGMHTKMYFNFFDLPSGVNFQPFFRYYFKKRAPSGVFIQAKVAYGFFKNHYTYISSNEKCRLNYDGYYECSKELSQFHSIGGGLAAGYQFIFGKKKHGSVDFFGGFSYHKPIRVTEKDGSDPTFLFNVGEFSIFDGGIRLGVAF